MYDLSVCLAGIRKDNWDRLYDSIVKSIGKYTFELIICGPHAELTQRLQKLDNVRCIQDYGAPTRAQQISLKDAQGRYITWTADDGWFLPSGLSKCIEMLDKNPKEKKCVVTQYNEGMHEDLETGLLIPRDGLGSVEKGMYYINTHAPVRSEFYPDDFLIFNSVVLPTQYFKDLGGFDCRFEVCPMAFVDFGARAQLDGIDVTLVGVIFECTHFPGDMEDHGPVHFAQIEHDQPLYAKIWGSPHIGRPNPLERIVIDYDNWVDQPRIWTRRFRKPTKE